MSLKACRNGLRMCVLIAIALTVVTGSAGAMSITSSPSTVAGGKAAPPVYAMTSTMMVYQNGSGGNQSGNHSLRAQTIVVSGPVSVDHSQPVGQTWEYAPANNGSNGNGSDPNGTHKITTITIIGPAHCEGVQSVGSTWMYAPANGSNGNGSNPGGGNQSGNGTHKITSITITGPANYEGVQSVGSTWMYAPANNGSGNGSDPGGGNGSKPSGTVTCKVVQADGMTAHGMALRADDAW